MDKLLLVSHADLMILWDALIRHRISLVPGDPDFREVVSLQERVDRLLSNSVDRMGNPKLR